ncbi:MAG TPA: ATP-binding protein, partial [Verrucomicrobiae bacterium]|nr:ATP-binding protein [Verrucomicrobiae bacterium]
TICGFVAVTPSILAWRNVESRGVTVARLGEFGVLLLLLVFVTNLVFGDIFPGQISSTLAFLLIPMLLWAALRFGRRGTALAVLVLAAMAIYATLHGSGPFAMPNRRASLLLLQSFILIVSMLAFVVQADAFERRGALSALQTSESRYRELFEGNPEPMWVYDDETLLFLDANNAAIQSYGFTKGEFLGMRVGDIRLPEESEIAETQSGETFQVQCRHRKRDGSIIYAETTRHRVLMEGRRAWLVLSTDITERKRAENHSLTFSMLGRKLSAARSSKEAAAIMFEAADALFRWDSAVFELLMPGTDKAITILCVDTIQGQRREVLFDNPLRSLGTEGMKALRGPKLVLRPPHSLFPEGTIPFGDTTRPSESLMFAPVKNGAKTIGSLSLQSYTQNAFTEGDLHSLQALADHCGGALERIRAEAENERLTIELREHVENLRSFNEKLEQRVQERTSQLQTINKELEAFSYSVSHDLRAPLRSIRGFSEVLLERHSTQLDARGQDYLRRVCQSSEQMDKLIEDLLKLSRVGRAELQWRDVDLTAMAETIVDELRKNNPERHVEIKIAPGLRAYGDERLLRIVLDNLLQNAWKFTSKTAGPCITVERVPGSPPAFCVRDNGAGFDMRHANRLFGVFQRLHTTSEFPGTGVGLATAQRILNRHGGRLWAEAQVDRGATFYFTLPAHEPS